MFEGNGDSPSVVNDDEMKHLIDDPTHARESILIESESVPTPLARASARFFKELSLAYETCRLGQHLPYHQPELNDSYTAFICVDSSEGERTLNYRFARRFFFGNVAL